jgi:hypothetical protein
MMGIANLLNALKSRLDGRQIGGRPDSFSQDETETVRKIVRQLDNLEPERARFIAAFAYILSRVARADINISYL